MIKYLFSITIPICLLTVANANGVIKPVYSPQCITALKPELKKLNMKISDLQNSTKAEIFWGHISEKPDAKSIIGKCLQSHDFCNKICNKGYECAYKRCLVRITLMLNTYCGHVEHL